MLSDGPIVLRDAVPEDRDVLFRIYASTREAEMSLVPWSDEQKQAFLEMQFEAQDRDYRHRYPRGDFKIILCNSHPVGRIYVNRGEDLIHILDITVLPEYRNAGLGSRIMRDLLDEATQTGKTVDIFVEDFNPSLRLFERLGFSAVRQEGYNVLLEWSKPA